MAPRHITVFLPAPYRGGTLRVTKTVARMILMGSRKAGSPCDVRLAILPSTYDVKADFSDVIADGIEVREFNWRTVSKAEVETANLMQGRDMPLEHEEYLLPEDGINNCMDADLWFFVSDRFGQPLAPVRPYAVFATDYIQRYIPKIFPKPEPGVSDLSFLQSVRQADAVVVTTPHTGNDVVSYVGVPRAKVHLAPMDFDPTALAEYRPSQSSRRPYIVWPTNPTRHKNHIRAFEALTVYYQDLDGKLDVRVTGPHSKWMDPGHKLKPEYGKQDYVEDIRRLVASSAFGDKVAFLGDIPDRQYTRELAEAVFLWHPTLIDNGTFVVAEAAYLGTPSLANDYPPMRYISERFGLPTKFFNARSVDDMAEALKGMEEAAAEIALHLPNKEQLEQFSWQAYSSDYWTMIERIAA